MHTFHFAAGIGFRFLTHKTKINNFLRQMFWLEVFSIQDHIDSSCKMSIIQRRGLRMSSVREVNTENGIHQRHLLAHIFNFH